MVVEESDRDYWGHVDYMAKMSKALTLNNLGLLDAVDIQIEPITSLGGMATFKPLGLIKRIERIEVFADVKKIGSELPMGKAAHAFALLFVMPMLEGQARVDYNESDGSSQMQARITFWDCAKKHKFVRFVTFRSDGMSIHCEQGRLAEIKRWVPFAKVGSSSSDPLKSA